jgi:hypothetical protein
MDIQQMEYEGCVKKEYTEKKKAFRRHVVRRTHQLLKFGMGTGQRIPTT